VGVWLRRDTIAFYVSLVSHVNIKAPSVRSFCHQQLLEVAELLGHADALLLAFHEGGEAFGDVDLYVDGRLYCFLELCGMCCLAEYADLVVRQQVFKSLVSAGSVRVEDVVVGFVAMAHGVANLLVCVGGATHQAAYLLPVGMEEVGDAGEVARVAHVHGVGYGLDAWARGVIACLQVLAYYVVGVVGGNESLNGEPHLACEDGCRDVSEIAAWHADHEVVRHAHALELCVGMEVIERLGEEACHIDGVGRGELHVVAEVVVHECLLDKRLAVVEHAVHLYGCDVLSERGELALLNGADFSLGIEDEDADAVNIEESVGYGRSRVAACGNEHVYFLRAFLVYEMLEHACHEACSNVLEGKGGAMEEFEREYAVFYGLYRTGKGECVINYLLESVCGDVLSEECISHVVGTLLKGHAVYVVEKLCWQLTDALWHVKSTIGGKTSYDCLMKGGKRGSMVGAVVLH